MRIGSLCSGYGGLDMAVEEFFGADTAWHCEYEPAPSKILAAHWDVPNHHDLTKTDWSSVESVDIVTAGWPCQPWSAAGAQKGQADARAIWPSVADAIRRLRPGLVVLENVPAIVVLGELARAVGDLASLGYDAQWQCVRASDVGAPHRRERCFIVATDTQNDGLSWGRSSWEWRDGFAHSSNAIADAASDGWHKGWTESAGQFGRHDVALSGSASLADAHDAAGDGQRSRTEPRQGSKAAPDADRGKCDGRQQDQEWSALERAATTGPGGIDWGDYAPAIERWAPVVGRPAPSPTEPGRNGERLSPLLVEWMMGLPAGWVTDIDITRNEQLKALGNGVVPQQALTALAVLHSYTRGAVA